MQEELIIRFKEIYGPEGNPQVYFAPGRVNLIGEHTDYNGGHVFPCALTIGTYAVVRIREDMTLRFYSLNFEEKGIIEASLNDLTKKDGDDWAIYPKGVLWAMLKQGYRISFGFDILYYGNIPSGSGLSSSASIEVLTGYVLKELFALRVSLIKLALIAQLAENSYVGVNCGIMDQFAIAMGREQHAIFLDTADLSYDYAPLELNDAGIIIMNTNKKRGLGDSKYNERRSECEAALADLQKQVDIKSLGELSIEEFEEVKSVIKDPIHQRRAKHAVYENIRTVHAVKALREKDITLFGKLMVASHESLRYDYEVTGIELDTIVEAALRQEGVLGARMTGAGFGGCGVAIVKKAAMEAFIKNVDREYTEKIGYEPAFYEVGIGGGPCVLN